MYLSLITLPLIGSIISGFFGRKVGISGSELITIICVMLTTMLSVLVFFEVGLNSIPISLDLFTWIDSESLHILWGFTYDSLTVSMLIPVLIVSSLVHLYSLGYTRDHSVEKTEVEKLPLYYKTLTPLESKLFNNEFFKNKNNGEGNKTSNYYKIDSNYKIILFVLAIVLAVFGIMIRLFFNTLQIYFIFSLIAFNLLAFIFPYMRSQSVQEKLTTKEIITRLVITTILVSLTYMGFPLFWVVIASASAIGKLLAHYFIMNGSIKVPLGPPLLKGGWSMEQFINKLQLYMKGSDSDKLGETSSKGDGRDRSRSPETRGSDLSRRERTPLALTRTPQQNETGLQVESQVQTQSETQTQTESRAQAQNQVDPRTDLWKINPTRREFNLAEKLTAKGIGGELKSLDGGDGGREYATQLTLTLEEKQRLGRELAEHLDEDSSEKDALDALPTGPWARKRYTYTITKSTLSVQQKLFMFDFLRNTPGYETRFRAFTRDKSIAHIERSDFNRFAYTKSLRESLRNIRE